ncbi:MAG: hypothetical protein JWM09_950 [Francisellaceae bacterium]|nr:hypothetical protein [Francisellaceae bacterium]
MMQGYFARKKASLSALVMLLLPHLASSQEPTHFCIISPGYKIAHYFQEAIESVTQQTYKNWKMVIIDDHSPDNSANLIAAYLKKQNLAPKIILVANQNNQGAMPNIYNAINQYCHDNDVVINLDADDLLANKQVLQKVAKIYEDKNIWLTYGNYDLYIDTLFGPKSNVCEILRDIPHKIRGNNFFINIFNWLNEIYINLHKSYINYWYPSAPERCFHAELVPQEILEQNLIRTTKWRTPHLKTFYAWLYKKINVEDFKYQGKFIKVLHDFSMMIPMVEMASRGHTHFFPEVLYLYRQTDMNDCQINSKEIEFYEHYIRGLPRYSPL